MNDSYRWAVPPAPPRPERARFRVGGLKPAPEAILETLAIEDYRPWLSSAGMEALQVGWSERRRAVIEEIFNEVRRRFVWRADGKLDTWRRLTRRVMKLGGKFVKFYTGDCDDFALELLHRLVTHESKLFPRGCLRLAACRMGRRDHLVLIIETDAGTLVLCNLGNIGWRSAPPFRFYKWRRREVIGGGGRESVWEELEPPTLEDLARRSTAGA